MAEIIYFQSRSEIDAKQNLNDFICHCSDNLELYEEQGGFSANYWYFVVADRKYSMVFSKYNVKNDPYNFDPMDEPFLLFAKAWIRYSQHF